MANDQESRIVVDPDVHFGKPCVAGTRIPVRDVLELVQEGLSFEEITTDYYPDLEEADVKACVQYAIDTISHHRAPRFWPQACIRPLDGLGHELGLHPEGTHFGSH